MLVDMVTDGGVERESDLLGLRGDEKIVWTKMKHVGKVKQIYNYYIVA